MQGYIGLIIFGEILEIFAIIIIPNFRRVETGEEFESERGWQLKDRLQELGRD